jgi:hypothetical protein
MSIRVLRLMEYVYPDLEAAHRDMERWYVQGTTNPAFVSKGHSIRSTVILNPTPFEEPIVEVYQALPRLEEGQ